MGFHKYLKYESGQPFRIFPGEVSQARCNGDSALVLKQLSDTQKLKENSFCGKMIEDLMKHLERHLLPMKNWLMNHSGHLSLKTWKKLIPHSTSENTSDKSLLRSHTNVALPFISLQSCVCWNSTTTFWINTWIAMTSS